MIKTAYQLNNCNFQMAVFGFLLLNGTVESLQSYSSYRVAENENLVRFFPSYNDPKATYKVKVKENLADQMEWITWDTNRQVHFVQKFPGIENIFYSSSVPFSFVCFWCFAMLRVSQITCIRVFVEQLHYSRRHSQVVRLCEQVHRRHAKLRSLYFKFIQTSK